MSISVSGTTRIPPTSRVDTGTLNTAQSSAAEIVSNGVANAEAPSLEAAFKAPVPLRFPWLSRLSSELEPAAKQKSPFASLAITGDNVDQSV